jgi:hypothetical protein
MDISGVPDLEAGICIFEVVAALRVVEPVLDVEMDEDDVGIGSDAVYFSTLISRLIGSQVFSGSMGDYFFSGRIVLRAGIAIGVPHSPGVVSGLIVIALSMEGEAADHASDLVVIGFKVLSSLHVA